MERRSSEFFSLLVAWRSKASRASSATMPEPLSMISISFFPPASTLTRMRVAPASIAFSIEFLDDRCGTLDNFAGGDLVGNVLGKYVDSSHALAVGAARAASDFQFTRPVFRIRGQLRRCFPGLAVQEADRMRVG